MAIKYRVELAQDGCDVEFAGDCDTLAEARELAATTPRTLPRSMYDTARAAGHVAGMTAPVGGSAEPTEPIEWIGDYAITAIEA